MTKGQIEAQISEAISRFENEYMGRGPEQIRSVILQDMVVIRLKGFLSVSEKNLAQTREGVELVKKVRSSLFESAKENLKEAIGSLLGLGIVSIYSDVSTRTGEKVILVIASENIEDHIQKTEVCGKG